MEGVNSSHSRYFVYLSHNSLSLTGSGIGLSRLRISQNCRNFSGQYPPSVEFHGAKWLIKLEKTLQVTSDHKFEPPHFFPDLSC